MLIGEEFHSPPPKRLERFSRFERGDRVRVARLRGDYRVLYFQQEGDRMTATIFGGSGGRSMFRTVAVDRLVKRRTQKQRGRR
jgi:hypothetical protein